MLVDYLARPAALGLSMPPNAVRLVGEASDTWTEVVPFVLPANTDSYTGTRSRSASSASDPGLGSVEGWAVRGDDAATRQLVPGRSGGGEIVVSGILLTTSNRRSAQNSDILSQPSRSAASM